MRPWITSRAWLLLGLVFWATPGIRAAIVIRFDAPTYQVTPNGSVTLTAVVDSDDEKAGVANFFRREHACTPEEYRAQSGLRKFGQELVRSKLPEGRLHIINGAGHVVMIDARNEFNRAVDDFIEQHKAADI